MLALLRTIFFISLITSLHLPLFAQSDKFQSGQPKKPASEKPSVSHVEAKNNHDLTSVQRRALDLLAQLSDAVKALDDESLKLKLQAQIADALWEHDENRARAQFESAFRAIAAVKAPSGNTRAGQSADLSLQYFTRSELLTLIAHRDVSLAKRLMDSLSTLSLPADLDPALSAQARTNQAGLYLSLARSLVSTDPQQAVEIAQLYLQGRTLPTFTAFLYELQREDARLADELFNHALAAFYNRPQKYLPDLTTLGLYALPNYGERNDRRNLIQQMDPTSKLITNPLDQTQLARAQSFLNVVYSILMQPGNSHYTNYDFAHQTLFFFDQYLPDKSADVRARLEEARSFFPPEQRRTLRGPLPPSTTQSLLAEAAAALDQKDKDRFYTHALFQAMGEGGFEQALSIVEKIGDKQSRVSWQATMRHRAALAAISKGDFETAYRYGKEITFLTLRAEIFAQLARAFYRKKDFARAEEILNEAEQSLVKADIGVDQALALLRLAGAASQMDPPRGFEITRSAVDAINRADKANNPTGGQATPISAINSFYFEQSFPFLARADFDRAWLLAQSLEKKDLAVCAQLAICRGVLITATQDKANPKKADKSE